jgi:hypothetical protein
MEQKTHIGKFMKPTIDISGFQFAIADSGSPPMLAAAS